MRVALQRIDDAAITMPGILISCDTWSDYNTNDTDNIHVTSQEMYENKPERIPQNIVVFCQHKPAPDMQLKPDKLKTSFLLGK